MERANRARIIAELKETQDESEAHGQRDCSLAFSLFADAPVAESG